MSQFILGLWRRIIVILPVHLLFTCYSLLRLDSLLVVTATWSHNLLFKMSPRLSVSYWWCDVQERQTSQFLVSQTRCLFDASEKGRRCRFNSLCSQNKSADFNVSFFQFINSNIPNHLDEYSSDSFHEFRIFHIFRNKPFWISFKLLRIYWWTSTLNPGSISTCFHLHLSTLDLNPRMWADETAAPSAQQAGLQDAAGG